MTWIVIYILFQLILAIGVILLGYFIYDKRYKSKQNEKVPNGFLWTSEITIDPTTGEKTRVYFHPDTGERFYRIE